jgi:DNA-binding protein YbaB
MSNDMSEAEAAAILAAESLAALQEQAHRLMQRELVSVSPDERVAVRVNGAGQVTGVRLSDNVLRRYDNAALAELVTRTVKNAQRRAREGAQHTTDELYEPVHRATQVQHRRLGL